MPPYLAVAIAATGPSAARHRHRQSVTTPAGHAFDWAVRENLTDYTRWPQRERVLFIGTQFSILYTSMYSPAEAATPSRKEVAVAQLTVFAFAPGMEFSVFSHRCEVAVASGKDHDARARAWA